METTENIRKMLNTRQLSLSFWQRQEYYRSIYVLAIIGFMLLTPFSLFDLELGWGYYACTALLIPIGFLLYKKLQKGLSFKEIKTNLSQNENYIKIRNTFEAMNIEVEYAGMTWLVGYANKLLEYPGERISIINTEGAIYVNSISTKGRLKFKANKQNIKIFHQYFYLE